MSENGHGRACRSRAHAGKGMQTYDDLPREVRDKIKIAKNNICCGCIRNKLRRLGLDALLAEMDHQRRWEKEKRGREVWLVPRSELKP